MGESLQHNNSSQPTASSRFGLRNATGGGEIVEVQGGHIVRSTGRKDRHSKVCTAKGPRDRRVRLSAHTAIQFYDVQDRLGYDRPSKAVDWLIKKAKAAIDELAELPAWKPTNCSPNTALTTAFDQQDEPHQQHSQQLQIENENQQQLQIGNHHENSSSFLPPSMDSDSIADTIKSFFPMGASSAAQAHTLAGMQFQSFQTAPDLLSRTSSQSQDLRLSLHSFQDHPMLLHHHQHHHQQHNPTHHQNEQANMFSSPQTHISFDGSGWTEHPPWGGGGSSGGGGFVFNGPTQTTPFLQPLFGQTQMFSTSQRGPLQSSNTPSIRPWIDPPQAFAAMDHHQHQHQNQTLSFHPSSVTGGIGFASGGGEFSRYGIPTRIQGEEEEHDGISDKPSSASSDSRH